MRVKNLLISVVMIGLVGYGGLKFYMYYKAKGLITDVLACAGMPQGATNSLLFDYKMLSVSVFGQVGIKDLSFHNPVLDEDISIDEIRLEKLDYEGELKSCPVPERLFIVIDGLRMNVSLLEKMERMEKQVRQKHNIKTQDKPQIIRRLGYQSVFDRLDDYRDLGYDQLVMDLEFDVKLDSAKKEATIRFKQSIEDMGDTEMEFVFAGMAKTISTAILGVQVKEAKIVFRDDSYMDRLIKLYAEENNTSIDEYRKQLIVRIDKDIASKDIKLSKESIENIKSFIQKPDRIILTAYPFRPVGIESIKHYKPGDVPMLLNLQAHLE